MLRSRSIRANLVVFMIQHTLQQSRGALGHVLEEYLAAAEQQEAV